MQKYFQQIIGIITLLFCLNNHVIAINRDYPQTEEERKLQDMGSLAGKEGLTFSPSKIKNESTKTKESQINKYLWQAAVEILNFIPLASTDSNGGIIITEWYSPKENKNFRFKINIVIKDNIISPDSIQVRVFEQTLKQGQWVDQHNASNLALSIEDKILRKARELYISVEGKG
ncbi:DUF3576 domain-containing protein [Candidatus Tisiphia endosymbiont of Nemotelus uliginosus]|uniref:DUF3576 domain-containing protein n=1 Tax=Candidatus Tisiphia endosymbiont of Nemotelus uliginosus TaxID=3077926 RepID=UPI0035C8C1AD